MEEKMKVEELEEMNSIISSDEFTNPDVEGIVYLSMKDFCWTE